MKTIVLLGLLACKREPEPPESSTASDDFAGLDPRSMLARISLDVRGVRPTREEIARIEADSNALPAILDEMLSDPRFEDRVIALYREVFLTQTDDYFFFDYAAVEKIVPNTDELVDSAADEPIRVMAHIAVNDLPYDLAVTGDFTVIDDALAPLWPTDRDPSTDGWSVAHYTDGRPTAGVLATNGLWWRYPSTASNKQRKRANTASKLFACRDFLRTEVPFDNNVNLLDEEALNNAIRTNVACRTCHDTLDPIASYFWGFNFTYDDGFLLADGLRYHPERERDWVEQTGVAPGWFEQPGTSLRDLGEQLVRDPAFDRCAVQHVYEHLLRRELTGEDQIALESHVTAFRGGGRTVRSIWRSISSDPRYLGVVGDGVSGVVRKVATPDLLRTAVLDLTGFDWSIEGVTLLDHEGYTGIATLAGGIDGATVTRPATSPSATTALVQDRLATGAAAFAVERERALPDSERRLLAGIDFSESLPADEDEIASVIAGLYASILTRSVSPADEPVLALLDLWSEVHTLDGKTESAWAAVITALLRDPDFVTY